MDLVWDRSMNKSSCIPFAVQEMWRTDLVGTGLIK
jgi:hypothetical protein